MVKDPLFTFDLSTFDLPKGSQSNLTLLSSDDKNTIPSHATNNGKLSLDIELELLGTHLDSISSILECQDLRKQLKELMPVENFSLILK